MKNNPNFLFNLNESFTNENSVVSSINQNEVEHTVQPNEAFQAINNDLLQENIKCMEEHKVNGSYVMPFKANDNQVYLYLGHGSSLCNPDGSLIIKKVPENCLYITQTVCGIVNTLDANIVRAFRNERNAPLWRDPITNLKKIQRLFKFAPMVHIHYPGCSYVDTGFFPLSDQDLTKETVQISLSGLLPLQNAYKIPPGSKLLDDEIEILNTNDIPVERLEEFFEFSVFPTLIRKNRRGYTAPKSARLQVPVSQDNRVDLPELKREVDRIASNIPVSDLMKEYPGVHFNFLCRSMVGFQCRQAQSKRSVAARRRHSVILQKTPFNTIRKIVDYGALFRNTNVRTTDPEMLELIKQIEDQIRDDPDMTVFYKMIEELSFQGTEYPLSLQYLETIFSEIYMKKFKSLLQENVRMRILQRLVDVLKYEPTDAYQNDPKYSMERRLLEEMALMAFHTDRGDILQLVCAKGAPVGELESEYRALQSFTNRRSTLQTRKRSLMKQCKRAFAKTYKRLRNENR